MILKHPSQTIDRLFQVNDSLYELHRPVDDPSMQVVYFHGLPFEDLSEVMHLSTWETRGWILPLAKDLVEGRVS